MVKPLITRDELSFLNDQGKGTNFPLNNPQVAAKPQQLPSLGTGG